MDWKIEKDRIYAVDEKEELMSEVTFTYEKEDEININHVYVNPILRGQGIASEAMNVMVDYLRKSKLKATATCSYANSWFNKNRDKCEDIISENNNDSVIACNINGKH